MSATWNNFKSFPKPNQNANASYPEIALKYLQVHILKHRGADEI